MIDPRLYYFNPYLQESYSYNDFRSHLFRLNEDVGDRYADFVLGGLKQKWGDDFDPNTSPYARDYDSRSSNSRWAKKYANNTRHNPPGNGIVGRETRKTQDYLEDLKSNPKNFRELTRAMQAPSEGPRRSKNNY